MSQYKKPGLSSAGSGPSSSLDIRPRSINSKPNLEPGLSSAGYSASSGVFGLQSGLSSVGSKPINNPGLSSADSGPISSLDILMPKYPGLLEFWPIRSEYSWNTNRIQIVRPNRNGRPSCERRKIAARLTACWGIQRPERGSCPARVFTSGSSDMSWDNNCGSLGQCRADAKF